MGCGGSKQGKKEDNKIESEFPETKIEGFDSFFGKCKTLLETAEKLRAGILESKETAFEVSGMWMLVNPGLSHCFTVCAQAMSAQNEGSIKAVGINIEGEAPFLTVDTSSLHGDTLTLINCFQEYFKTLVEGPESIITIVTTITELVQEGTELAKTAKEQVEGSPLDFFEKAKAVVNIAKSMKVLGQNLAKCTQLKDVILQAKKDLPEIIPKLKGIITSADEVGLKAFQAKKCEPKEICEAFPPCPKKTPQEIKEEVKNREKNAKKAK